MIQINELRIGNWILEANEPSCVYAIDRGGISFHRINDIPVNKETGCTMNGGEERFKPIPLTPALLYSAGFSTPHEYVSTVVSKGGVMIDYYLGKFYLRENNRITIDYLHQLQNLYFALTGGELVVNL